MTTERYRFIPVFVLLVILFATIPWATADVVFPEPDCNFRTPQLCLGRFVEIERADRTWVRGVAVAVQVDGVGFDVDGQTWEGDNVARLLEVDTGAGVRVWVDLFQTFRVRAVDPPAFEAVDALLIVMLVIMGGLVLVLMRQPGQRVDRSGAPQAESPPAEPVAPQAPARALAQDLPPPSFDLSATRLGVDALAGLPVETVTYAAVGGGMGSFAWVDALRVSGAAASEIAVISSGRSPYASFERLCQQSQVVAADRLRSDSGATPDNLWGWPGAGLRELAAEIGAGRIGAALGIGWGLLAEPDFAPYYTPRSGQVFAAIDRECGRIGWGVMLRQGVARSIRLTEDGRYAIFYAALTESGFYTERVVVARYLHLATGCSTPRFAPDLAAYRATSGDAHYAVQAYEDHAHIYRALAESGGTVLLRGRGIAAARIIERLAEVRAGGADVRIVHLLRSAMPAGRRVGRARSSVAHHWRLQTFNWPKSAFGGAWKARIEAADEAERAYIYEALEGTTTPDRPEWRRLIAHGRAEGWYQQFIGAPRHIERWDGRMVVTVDDLAGVECAMFAGDFLIDATGFDPALDHNPLLADLLEQYNLTLTSRGRLVVSDQFEIEGLRTGGGRAFAAGIIAAGGAYAPVDSYMGLQYAALRSLDHLAGLGVPGLRRLDGLRSLTGWLRWARGTAP